MPPEILLQVQNLRVRYGAHEALRDLTFEVARGQIVALIGANGAGKSTLLKTISGLVRPSAGQIIYRGKSIVGLAPHLIARQRIAHAPEGRGIFLNLSVEENLDLGAWSAPDKKTYLQDLEHAFDLFPRLKERRRQNSGTLSGGEQQMLAIARALMGHPELLLLDEPSLGLAPQMIERIFEIIQRINNDSHSQPRSPAHAGTTVLLVEQNALQALQIAHYGIVLETGRAAHAGAAAWLLNSDLVRRAYLGLGD